MSGGDPAGSTHLVVRVEGVVLPTWFAACAMIGAVLSCVTLCAVLVIGGFTLVRLEGEIRVLQLGVNDVQDTLIKKNLATRQDFAPRTVILTERDGDGKKP